MSDPRHLFTADDINAAFWQGYQAGVLDRQGKPARRPVPRGWWLLLALAASLAMWAGIIAGLRYIIA